jgi:phage head maturation protease
MIYGSARRGQLRAALHFSETLIGEGALRAVQRGLISGISIRNQILEWRQVDDDGNEVDPGDDRDNDLNFVATHWELLDVSLCEEPLDRGARIGGYSTRDVRERIRVRERMVDRQRELHRPPDDDGLRRVFLPPRGLIFYGPPEPYSL